MKMDASALSARGRSVRLGLLVEIGDRELGPGPMKRLSDPPGDRLVIGDADHKGALIRQVEHTQPQDCAMHNASFAP